MKQFRGIGLVLVLLVVALVALPAMAAIDKAPVGKGSAEIGAAISVSSVSSKEDVSGAETENSTQTMLLFSGGYFLTNAIQLGLGIVGIGYDQEETSASATIYSFKGAYNFQLKNSPTILPWAAIKLGGETFVMDDGTETMTAQGFAYGAEAGVRYFVSRQASVNAQIDYDISTLTAEDVDFDTNTLQVMVGLSVFFGGAK